MGDILYSTYYQAKRLELKVADRFLLKRQLWTAAVWGYFEKKSEVKSPLARKDSWSTRCEMTIRCLAIRCDMP